MPRVRFSLFLIALALLLPLAASVETCDTCLAGDSGCCPPSCVLCLCCAPAGTELSGPPRMERRPSPVLLAGEPAVGGPASADPRDVFHVPKPA